MIVPADRYYVERPVLQQSRDYWEPAFDPDGNMRDRLAERERLWYLEDVAEELAFVRSLPAGKIVDYGCGPGWFLSEFPNWQRLGVESSLRAFECCLSRGIPCVRKLHDMQAASVDVVVMLHVIEHLRDPVFAINDMYRILKPGGWLVIGTPDFNSPCARRFNAHYRMLHDSTHCSLFTNESLHRLLRDLKFDICDVRYPFPDRYYERTYDNAFDRWYDTSKVSPPWPGNWMTFYCSR